MSRIGKQPIIIPEGVNINIKGRILQAKGPKGELSLEFRPEVIVEMKDKQLFVTVKNQSKESKAFWGLFRSLINNAVEGVSKGFEKQLEIRGVGFKANPTESGLTLELGFSHKIEFKKPEGIEFDVKKNIIIISGINKQLVGQTAAEIRGLKRPEPYKGKGIRYVGEQVRIKAGKRAADAPGVAGK